MYIIIYIYIYIYMQPKICLSLSKAYFIAFHGHKSLFAHHSFCGTQHIHIHHTQTHTPSQTGIAHRHTPMQLTQVKRRQLWKCQCQTLSSDGRVNIATMSSPIQDKGLYTFSMSICTKWNSICTKWNWICTKWNSICTKWNSICTKWYSICTKWNSICTKWWNNK